MLPPDLIGRVEGEKKSTFSPQRGGIFVETDVGEPHPSGLLYRWFQIRKMAFNGAICLDANRV